MPINRIRIAIDIQDPNATRANILDPGVSTAGSNALVSFTTTRLPKIFRLSNIKLELGFYQDGVFLTDISGFSEIRVGIKSASNIGGEYSSGPYSAALNGALTEAQWNTKSETMAHAILSLSPAQTNVGEGTYNVVFVVCAVDSLGALNPIATVPFTIYEAGITGTPKLDNEIEQTADYIRPKVAIQLQGSDGLWYSITLVAGESGKQTFHIADVGQA